MMVTPNKRVPPGRRPGGGFTLVEVALSIGIVSIILVGAGSAVLVGTRAISDKTDTPAHVSAADEAMRQVMTDVRMATSFTERTSTEIEFKVPTRDDGPADETIRYSWSGVAGNPLLRSYNGGPAVAILEDVHHLDFRYLTQVLEAASTGQQESDELLLISYYPARWWRHDKNYKVEDLTKWCAQYFEPTLPNNTLSWKITRVKFAAKQEDWADCTLGIQIRGATHKEVPDDTIIEEVSLPESALHPWWYAWVEVSFSSVTDLDPDKGYCLVIAHTGGPSNREAARVLYIERARNMPRDTHWTKTGDAGDHWDKKTNKKDMLFYVYGKVTTEGPPEWP